MKALTGPATTKGFDDIENALGRRRAYTLDKLCCHYVSQPVRLVIGKKAGIALLKRSKRLLKRFLEATAYCHDLSYRFHARGERLRGALELLKSEPRNLDNAVIKRWLKAGRSLQRDVIGDLVKGVAHSKQRCSLGYRKARRLGGQRRRAAHARVHLDYEHAAVMRVHGKLHVRSSRRNSYALQDRN